MLFCFLIVLREIFARSLISMDALPYTLWRINLKLVISFSYLNATCTAAVYNFQNPICTAVYCRLLSHAFTRFMHGRHDIIDSRLSQIFTYDTVSVNVVTFFYLSVSNHQLSSSTWGCNFCNMFLCTFVYKFSKFVLRTYADVLSIRRQKQKFPCI